MHSTSTARRLLLALLLGVATAPVAQAQTKLVNNDGWQVSAVRQITAGEPTKVEKRDVGGRVVSAAFYEPTEALVIEVPVLTPWGDRLWFQMPRLTITRVTALSVGSKTYAYILETMQEHFDEKTRKGGYGHGYPLIFVDEEGNGIFNLLIEWPPVGFEVALPKWLASGSASR